MPLLSKTTIVTAAFAIISSQAFSEACQDFKPDMAYMFRGSGHMMTAALDEHHRGGMMKYARKLAKDTVFFMKDGELYSASGMAENSLDELHFE